MGKFLSFNSTKNDDFNLYKSYFGFIKETNCFILLLLLQVLKKKFIYSIIWLMINYLSMQALVID